MRRHPLPALVLAISAALIPSLAAIDKATAGSPRTAVTAPTTADDPAAHDPADPRLTRPTFVNKDSLAWHVSRENPQFRPIARVPQAYWVSSEFFPLDSVRQQVRAYARKARQHHRIPLVSIYAIPNRDCGRWSAGGWSPKKYRTWSTRLARGLEGQHAIAVVEPDALGLMSNCPKQTKGRTRIIRHAVEALSDRGVWTYIAAGHRGWVKPRVMADRLVAAGVDQARGYTVNASSFVSTTLSKRYGRKIGQRLRDQDVRGSKMLVDTSRNGGGATDGNDWCNPTDALIGQQPTIIDRGYVDRYVWIGAPGQSDGYCHGGPAPGQWFPTYARQLMGG